MISRIAHNRPGSFLQSLIATIEALLDKRVMDQINKSGQDIKNGRVRNVSDFLDEL
ncbi:MAG: hypothetical protein ACYCT2_09445 [Thermoplasmataceae archaeon]